jgi:ribonuclease HI
VFQFAIPIQPTVTNNQAEYEALLRGFQYLRKEKAIAVEIFWRFRASYKTIEWPIEMQR